MHTLYMVYDENNNITGFVIDNVSTTQNFISLDRGPLSYLQSIIDNLNAYIKKNGNLTVDNYYIDQIYHGKFDQTYGAIEDKRTEDPNYTFKSSTTTNASTSAASTATSATSAASSTQSTASQTSSTAPKVNTPTSSSSN